MAESSPNNKRDWSRSVGIIAVLVLALLMFVGVVVLFGAVDGEEFSPTNFARRSFVFYRIPVVKIQVTPVVRTSITNALESHLAARIFSEAESAPPFVPESSAEDAVSDGPKRQVAKPVPRWDIVRVTPLSQASEFGSAYCLCAYLDRDLGGTPKWLTWTKAHKQLAQTLWPIVRQAAIQRLYFCIPDLMTAAEIAAERGTGPDKLQVELRSILDEAASLRRSATEKEEPPAAAGAIATKESSL